MKKIDVLVLDANQDFVKSLSDYLTTVKSIDTVRIEHQVDDMLRKVRSQKPDLVLLDSGFLEKHSAQLIDDIRESNPRTKVCLLSVFEKDTYQQYAIANGADGATSRLNFEQQFEEVVNQLFE